MPAFRKKEECVSSKKKEHNSRFWIRISSGGVGGFPREGVGASKFGMSLENPGKIDFLVGCPGFWVGYPGGDLKVRETKACVGLPPTPDRAPNPHFLEKRVSGSKNPHFPSPSHDLEKGSFPSKNPHFPCVPLVEKRDFLTENSLFQAEGKWGFLDPKTLFSRKWGFGALSGVRGKLVFNFLAPVYVTPPHCYAPTEFLRF